MSVGRTLLVEYCGSHYDSLALAGDAEEDEAMPITTADQARQFARDYDWSTTQPTIEDPEFAADEILSHLDGEVHDEVRGVLRAELIDSAEREARRRAER